MNNEAPDPAGKFPEADRFSWKNFRPLRRNTASASWPEKIIFLAFFMLCGAVLGIIAAVFLWAYIAGHEPEFFEASFPNSCLAGAFLGALVAFCWVLYLWRMQKRPVRKKRADSPGWTAAMSGKTVWTPGERGETDAPPITVSERSKIPDAGILDRIMILIFCTLVGSGITGVAVCVLGFWAMSHISLGLQTSSAAEAANITTPVALGLGLAGAIAGGVLFFRLALRAIRPRSREEAPRG